MFWHASGHGPLKSDSYGRLLKFVGFSNSLECMCLAKAYNILDTSCSFRNE